MAVVLAVIFLGTVLWFGDAVESPKRDGPQSKDTYAKHTLPSSGPPDFRSKIQPYAVVAMDRAGWPQLYARWGEKAVQRANALQERVALVVATYASCDRVETVNLSQPESTPSHVRFFVDCKNGRRFNVDESELNAYPDSVPLRPAQ